MKSENLKAAPKDTGETGDVKKKTESREAHVPEGDEVVCRSQ